MNAILTRLSTLALALLVFQAPLPAQAVSDILSDRGEVGRRIGDAIASYEFGRAVSMIDTLLFRSDSLAPEELRSLSLSKARCLKKLYRFKEAGEILGTVVSEDDFEVLGELADCHASDGRIDQALTLYYLLVMKRPDNAHFRLQLLGLYNKIGDWKECVGQGKALLQLDSLPQVLSIVGKAYSNIGQTDSALVYYGKALERRPDNTGYIGSVCNLLMSKGEFGEVLGVTGHYLNTYTPDAPEVESIYAFASYQMKNYGEAHKAYAKLKDEGDESFPTFYYSGLSSFALGKYKEALDDYSKAWQIDSTNAMLAANYGIALSKVGRQEEALEMFGKCEGLMRPDPALVYKLTYGKGLAFYSMEDFREAIPQYMALYELDKSFISALSTIGYCYEQLKDYSAAKKWYEKYLEVGNPDTKAYAFVKESLVFVNSELFMEGKEEELK